MTYAFYMPVILKLLFVFFRNTFLNNCKIPPVYPEINTFKIHFVVNQLYTIRKMNIINQCLGSASASAWIRMFLTVRIRIRIRTFLCGCGCGSHLPHVVTITEKKVFSVSPGAWYIEWFSFFQETNVKFWCTWKWKCSFRWYSFSGTFPPSGNFT